MRLLIQVSSRPAAGAAQPAITALNAVSTVTVKASERTVRARREEMRKPSSGITPRISGSTQNRVGSSALSAIGEDAASIGPQKDFGGDLGRAGVAGGHGRSIAGRHRKRDGAR